MRITIILLTIGLHVNASIYSQSKKFDLNVKNLPLREVFKEIENKSQFHFLFGDNLLLLDKVVNVNLENSNVEQALDKLLANSDYSYKVLENNLIVIAPENFINRQNKKVAGIILDAATGDPLPGVSILIEGTTIGTISDVSGNYTIDVPGNNAILVFSYVGYLSERITVEDKTTIDLKLTPDVKKLEEVVVVGYGTQKKVNLTGSVGNIQMNDMENRPITNAGMALQGTVSGVYALQSSGQPGADGAVINIRGVGGFLDNNGPLVLIDGLPGNLKDVNANDIKSISVLKDAASSAIYGNRASNGVVIITTKRGTAGKMSVSYNGYWGIQEATSLPDVLNSVDYATLKNEAAKNSGKAMFYTDADIEKFKAHNDPLYPDINYFDVYYGKANMQNHRVNVSGGNENVQFAFMLGHLDQDGILVGTSYKKTDFRTNIDAYFLKNKKLRFSTNVAGNYGVKDEPTDIWSAKWYATNAPVTPLVNADGKWMANNGERNFYGEIKDGSTAIEKRYNLNGQVEAEYKIFKFLSAQLTYGVNLVSYNQNNFHANVTLWNPDGSNKQIASDLTVTDGKDVQTLLTSLLKFNKTFGKHDINALVGYSEEEYKYDWDRGSRSGFVNSQRVLNLGDAATQKNDAGSYDLGLLSYFGRLNYIFDGKYLFEANIRRDGSSRFASGHQWGTFPSFSGGWIISKENFMESISWLNLLKLRLSWGRLGNENIGNYYNGSDILQSGKNYSLGGSLMSGVAVTDMTNKLISWETAEQKNIGLDLAFSNGIDVTVDYFDKRTKSLLKKQPIPATMALGYPYANAGEVQNKGIEASFTYRKTFTNGLQLRTTLNLSHIVNEITKLDVPEELTSPKAIKVGAAINAFYGYEMDGIYQLSDFDYANGTYTLKPGVVSVTNFNAQPGDIKYKDQNGDGKVDMNNDRTIIGKQFPDLSYSWNINLDWKQFDLSIFFQGVKGIEGYTYYEISTPFSGFANMGSWWKDRWTPENPTNSMPSLTLDGVRNNIHSTFYMEDASYLRLKNIELGYTISPKIISKIGISSLRVYGNIQNAFTITDFKGFDPEQIVTETRAQAFPQVRIMSMGVSVNF
jgi:TonB-linked SusC/RagA family outer membrane protein